MSDDTKCVYCEKGKENDMGDIWFDSFPFDTTTVRYIPRPRILKRNGRYFLVVDGFKPLQISGCPICARSFKEEQSDVAG